MKACTTISEMKLYCVCTSRILGHPLDEGPGILHTKQKYKIIRIWGLAIPKAQTVGTLGGGVAGQLHHPT
jgi:hypothetical protein